MPLPALSNGRKPFGPGADCTLDLCPLEASILRHRPSVPANAIFLSAFAVSMAVHAWQGWRRRTWGFTACVVAGCLLEIAGYAGRLKLSDNPFHFAAFLIQIICLTIAPAGICSAIYDLLSQVISLIDPSISRVGPVFLFWFAMISDAISLVLQAAGGGISCVGITEHDVKLGEKISIAGLVFQVFTLLVFLAVFADFVLKVRYSTSRFWLDRNMTVFLALLFGSMFFILIRCVYRIVELYKGYFDPLFRNEALYIALESCMMCIAVILLNFGHPGMIFSNPQMLDFESSETLPRYITKDTPSTDSSLHGEVKVLDQKDIS